MRHKQQLSTPDAPAELLRKKRRVFLARCHTEAAKIRGGELARKEKSGRAGGEGSPLRPGGRHGSPWLVRERDLTDSVGVGEEERYLRESSQQEQARALLTMLSAFFLYSPKSSACPPRILASLCTLSNSCSDPLALSWSTRGGNKFSSRSIAASSHEARGLERRMEILRGKEARRSQGQSLLGCDRKRLAESILRNPSLASSICSSLSLSLPLCLSSLPYCQPVERLVGPRSGGGDVWLDARAPACHG
mmetsp:Transcript_20300/g.67752  ORF Transcript_20300/g.67752 Transcript_20300/m.67752 type:complete len:249 (-) Transcript_20300:232-978(-)